MTPNVPKPMFLAQIHPGLVGALVFYSPNNACVVGFLLFLIRIGFSRRGFAVPVPCGVAVAGSMPGGGACFLAKNDSFFCFSDPKS